MTCFVGNSIIAGEELERRRQLARAGIEYFACLIENEVIGLLIGLLTETLPNTGFQTFRMAESKVLTVSPFCLGEQTNSGESLNSMRRRPPNFRPMTVMQDATILGAIVNFLSKSLNLLLGSVSYCVHCPRRPRSTSEHRYMSFAKTISASHPRQLGRLE